MAAAGSTIPEAIAGLPVAAPFQSCPGAVRAEWIDHNGHLNLAYFILLLDVATDALWRAIGLGEAYRARTGFGTFAVETHTLYLGELLVHDETEASSLVLGADAKRLHICHELRRSRDGVVAARQELMYLTVDLVTRRSVPFPPATQAGLQAACARHAGLAPAWTGRRIAMPGSPPAEAGRGASRVAAEG